MPERIEPPPHRWGLVGPSHVELLLQDEECLEPWSEQWTYLWGRGAAGWFYRPYIEAIQAAAEVCEHVVVIAPHWRHANYFWERVRDELETKPISEIMWDYEIHEDPNRNMVKSIIYNDIAEYILSRHMLDKIEWLLTAYPNISMCFWSIYGLEKRTRHHDRIISYNQLARRFGDRMVSLRDLHAKYDVMTLYRDRDFHPTNVGYERMRNVFERYMGGLTPTHELASGS